MYEKSRLPYVYGFDATYGKLQSMQAHGHTHVGGSVKPCVRMSIPRSGEGDFWGQRDTGPPLRP